MSKTTGVVPGRRERRRKIDRRQTNMKKNTSNRVSHPTIDLSNRIDRRWTYWSLSQSHLMNPWHYINHPSMSLFSALDRVLCYFEIRSILYLQLERWQRRKRKGKKNALTPGLWNEVNTGISPDDILAEMNLSVENHHYQHTHGFHCSDDQWLDFFWMKTHCDVCKW